MIHLGNCVVAVSAVMGATLFGAPAHAEKVVRAVMHSDLKIVDPIWTTAYTVRNHGYMIYDTLLAMDANGEVKPQMLATYEVSADKLVHTFALRDGLLWHDGQPVTSEDCIASIRRWAAKDTTGQKLMTFVSAFEAKDPKTFVIKLKEPTGLVLLGLGKPSSNVPFMMPKRVADTTRTRRSPTSPVLVRSSSSAMNGSPATKLSISRTPNTSHASSPLPVLPAAKWSRWTVWNGAPSPITSRRRTLCSRVRSITSKRQSMTYFRF